MTFRGLQRLLMILGGKVAASFRALVETTFTRVLAGDKSLIEVINANAESTAPGPTMAREALRSDPSPGNILPDDFLDRATFKRKWDELEFEERQVALEERKIAIEKEKVVIEKERKELKEQDLTFFKNSIQLLKTIHGNVLDERTTMQYEELVKNSTFTGINETTNSGVWESSGISIGIIAAKMGYTNCSDGQLSQIGLKMANEYRAKYNQNPSKHKQVHKGRMIDVNSYTERDLDMMKEVIKKYMDSQPSS